MNYIKAKAQAAASKLSKTSNAVMQAAKRSAGGADKSPDPESEAIIEKFKNAKHHLREMYLAAENLALKYEEQLVAEKKWVESVEVFQMHDPDVQEAKTTVDILTSLHATKESMLLSFKDLVLGSAHALLENEVKELRGLILKYDDLHTSFDVYTAKTQKEVGEKQAEAMRHLVTVSKEYEEMKHTLAQCSAEFHARKKDVSRNLSQYIRAMGEIFTKEAMSGHSISIKGVAPSTPAEVKKRPSFSSGFGGGAGAAAAASAGAFAATPSPAHQDAAPEAEASAPPPTAPADNGPATGTELTALYDYDATTNDELSFKAGDKIRLTAPSEDDGWFQGVVTSSTANPAGVGAEGVFPANYTDYQG